MKRYKDRQKETILYRKADRHKNRWTYIEMAKQIHGRTDRNKNTDLWTDTEM